MRKTANRIKSKYSPHPGLAKEEQDKERLRATTGRSFADWVALARTKGPKAHRDCTAWLRKEQGLASRDSWWIASLATSAHEEPNYDEPERLVDALYCGPKAALRPVHEKVVDAALGLGDDVIATSCKTMVPLYRKHVFVELRPGKDGVLAELALGDVDAGPRFQRVDLRNPGDRLTHSVILKSEEDVDADFVARLRVAYEHGAGKMVRSGKAETPSDLGLALKASRKAAATWDSCTDAMRRDWFLWIESAKQAPTRERRIGQTVEKLAAGKKKMYA